MTTRQTIIEIDQQSGFCFGVVTAINKAEEELAHGEPLFCIGDIVHNNAEVERLRQKGLATIEHSDLRRLKGAKVLLRAHGEPPSTYADAQANGIRIIDATCPVVLKLQQRIKDAYSKAQEMGAELQIVIYGKRGHAEVNGLVGQTHGTAIVIENMDEISAIDPSRPVSLYSQTTKSLEGFQEIISAISARMEPGVKFDYADTICRQVANRVEHLREFASKHDVVLFVAGEKSSNGRILLNHCLEVNPKSYLVPGPDALEASQITDAESIGICGATSTPRWLMEKVAERAGEYLTDNNTEQ
ncbi:MAG: 4-hydroxy-3-methylbut-2-enyl diphosphate reductase [Muribaculaceae bacterium]|nr:4-hydroxy-3-methylbut-2-enyl diphosphate reductase [Muribaculaceae bacterium]